MKKKTKGISYSTTSILIRGGCGCLGLGIGLLLWFPLLVVIWDYWFK